MGYRRKSQKFIIFEKANFNQTWLFDIFIYISNYAIAGV
ncbi:hypothetical protein EC07798_2616 [Escherichia coli 07798]|nr:hypothetical protein EC07798_2616 [Escherichia coli 07798]